MPLLFRLEEFLSYYLYVVHTVYCFFDGLAKTITCKFMKPSPALFNPRWKVNGTDIQSCCSNCANFTRLNGTHYVTLLNYTSFSPGVYKITLEHNLVGPILKLCADIVPRYTATVVVTGESTFCMFLNLLDTLFTCVYFSAGAFNGLNKMVYYYTYNVIIE